MGSRGSGRRGRPEPRAALTLQESPTRELGEPFPGAKESPPMFLAGGPHAPGDPGRPRGADRSQDGSAASAAEDGELGLGRAGVVPSRAGVTSWRGGAGAVPSRAGGRA